MTPSLEAVPGGLEESSLPGISRIVPLPTTHASNTNSVTTCRTSASCVEGPERTRTRGVSPTGPHDAVPVQGTAALGRQQYCAMCPGRVTVGQCAFLASAVGGLLSKPRVGVAPLLNA